MRRIAEARPRSGATEEVNGRTDEPESGAVNEKKTIREQRRVPAMPALSSLGESEPRRWGSSRAKYEAVRVPDRSNVVPR